VRNLLSLATAFLLAVSANANVVSDTDIRKILTDRIDAQKQNVGIVVGVIEPAGRRIVARGTFDNDKRAVNGDTLFEIGSVTKVFTALLLADAVQRGELALTDPVSKFLPAGVKMPERDGKKITLQDLATHTSALPRLPANFAPKDAANPYADYTVAQLYDFLSTCDLPRDIGTTHEYSNLGVGLLGHVLALRAHTDYETLVRTRITAPLGMKSTAITLSEPLQRRLAPGHDAERKRVKNWDFSALAGAGALRSTANDLLTFLSAFLKPTPQPLAPAMKSLLTVRRETPAPHLEIALGWFVTKLGDGREIIWHNGGTGGYRSYLGYDRKNGTGVVVLSNMYTDEGVDDIGRHLLDPATPVLTPPQGRRKISVDPATLDRYIGVYELAPKFVITITREDGQLFAQATGQAKLEIYPESQNRFFYEIVDAQITFESDGLILHQGGDHRAKRVDSHAAAPKQRTEVTVDPSLLDRYVGRYQLAPTFQIVITREENQLFLQATAQPKSELFAETERDFFLKAVDAQVTFVVEGAGPAAKLIPHQGGLDQEAKRVE
jgi:CubicO group peptidase (beta-lactamase class C family)